MPKTYECPFYKWFDRNTVHCEMAVLQFPDGKTKKQFIDRYCAAHPGWEKCPIAQTLWNYYERKGKAEAEAKKKGAATSAAP